MTTVDFKKLSKNKPVNFYRIASFAKNTKLDNKELLQQALNQNVFIEENKELLSGFIKSFDGKENIQSQLFQDVCASFIVGDKFEKTFLEFGATDGFELSNTYMLENKLYWKGVLSEPSPQWHQSLKENRKNSELIKKCIWKKSGEKLNFFMSDNGTYSTLNDFIDNDKKSMPINNELRKKGGKFITVETISLNDVMKKYFNNVCPSYISIDTEGSEYEILKSFNIEVYRPKLFTIEHNYTENESKIDDFLISNNYVRIFRKLTAFDAWYIPSEIL
ncbi:FkbM family methyltransferase [Candidatus Pelagibacter sp. HIMB1483]|uniref:FkbM family methyltransferase n=1 Tax=Candidatus Pelagibacter sp. HIMB1483 TaxID=3415414 RepID=UPI003F877540